MMKLEQVAVLVLAILAFMNTHAAATQIVEDDFNDGVIDTALWTISQSGTGFIDENGGVLRISTSRGEPGGQGMLHGELQLVGDFDVWGDYDWAAYDGSPHARTIMNVLNNDMPGSVGLNCHHWGAGSARQIIFGYWDGTTLSDVGTINGSGVPLTGKLRIRRQGTTISAYYWTSNFNWTSLGSVTAFGNPAYVTLHANNYETPLGQPPSVFPPFVVHWDNFHMEADQIIPEPATLSLLALGGLGLLRRRRR